MPGPREAALADVRRLLIVSLDLRREPDEIDPDTALFGTGLGLDSVDAVEIVIALEIELGVKLPDERTRRRALRSVNAMVDAVLASSRRRPVTMTARRATAEMRALREAVAVTPLEHVVALRITGEGAFALLDRLSTAPLFLREGEMRQITAARRARAHLRRRADRQRRGRLLSAVPRGPARPSCWPTSSASAARRGPSRCR